MKMKDNDWKLWLIRSTMGDTHMKPKDLCSFFWLFVLGMVSIPFSWMSHLINAFTNRNRGDYMHGFIGLVLLIVGMSVSSACFDKAWSESMPKRELLLWMYAAAPLGIIGIGLALVSVIFLIFGIGEAYEWVRDRWFTQYADGDDVTTKPSVSLVRSFARSVKSKYCPLIEYEND